MRMGPAPQRQPPAHGSPSAETDGEADDRVPALNGEVGRRPDRQGPLHPRRHAPAGRKLWLVAKLPSLAICPVSSPSAAVDPSTPTWVPYGIVAWVVVVCQLWLKTQDYYSTVPVGTVTYRTVPYLTAASSRPALCVPHH
jgi:hypothetical protein